MAKTSRFRRPQVFCPNSADWGNVADWAGALASFLAIGVALFIAFRESWSLKKERDFVANQESLKMAHLRAEVIRLAAEIEAIMDSAFGAGRPDQENIASWQKSIQESVEGCRLQLDALQTLAVPDPRLFGIIGRMIAETKFEFNVIAGGADLPYRIIQIAKSMNEHRQTVAALG